VSAAVRPPRQVRPPGRRPDVHDKSAFQVTASPIPPTRTPTIALSIVIPTYNERARLGELVAAVFDVFARHEVDGELVIVDDHSPDGTGALADELAARHRIRVVHRAGKLGLGSAVVDGFKIASGDVLGVMDADLSHPPDTLPRLLRALNDHHADVAIASRYVPGGATKNWPLVRRVMSRVACLLARPITSARDATSGFFLIRREAVQGVEIAARGFKICLELLVRGRVGSMVEVPYEFVDRAAGESKMNWREAAGYFRQIWDLWNYRRAHPVSQQYLGVSTDRP
jgi:dolichol-phosphate mannosyltransferase